MMIYTSYYAKIKHLPEGVIPVSISRVTPKWAGDIKKCQKLAPGFHILSAYKNTNDWSMYEKLYYEENLSKLDPNLVYNELKTLSCGNDVCLMCFEGPKFHCHRHLVKDWLNEHGIQCQEFDFSKES